MTQLILGLWAAAIIAVAVLWPQRLLATAIIMSVFEGAALVNAGGLAVSPYYFTVLLMALRCVSVRVTRDSLLGRTPAVRQLMMCAAVLTVLGVGGALVLPRVFAGIQVMQPRLAEEGTAGLQPSSSNIGQAAYLVLNVAFLWYVAQQSRPAELARQAVRAVMIAGTIVVFFGLYHYGALRFGLPYPDDILFSNNSFVMQAGTSVGDAPRICSTFTEPAGMAVFLVGLVAFLTSNIGEAAGPAVWRVPLLIGAIAVTLLSTSSTAYVGLGAVAAWRLGTNLMLPMLQGRLTTKQVVLTVGAIGAVAAVIILNPDLRDMIDRMVLQKDESASYDERSGANTFALHLGIETLGLGTGLGSNRASSLVPSLVSTVGVWGVGLFAALLWMLMRATPGTRGAALARHRALAAALLGIIGAKCLSSPDLNTSTMWAMMAALVAAHAAADVVPADVMESTAPVGAEESLLGRGVGAGHA